ADPDQQTEQAALGLGAEAEQQLRVLAHHHARKQRHPFAVRRQVVEGAHRHLDLVADALAVDQYLRRILLQQRPVYPSDHGAQAMLLKMDSDSARKAVPKAIRLTQRAASMRRRSTSRSFVTLSRCSAMSATCLRSASITSACSCAPVSMAFTVCCNCSATALMDSALCRAACCNSAICCAVSSAVLLAPSPRLVKAGNRSTTTSAT